ncbi:hypothetical protein PoB_002054800 [Plakobranchus ocellatus]|uniref:Uncharacterized protein n=1 Tax=Plakobranchus ocellatus TaxID=259542 RepID=A0AAV3ZHT6_9GAST|nr:hypothetical protein PoB_002054800 [Plakobranchus ocellatus]
MSETNHVVVQGVTPAEFHQVGEVPGSLSRRGPPRVTEDQCLIVSYFNSHSPSRGYPALDARGQEVDERQVLTNMQMLVISDEEPIFYSRVWKTTSVPD